MIYKVEIENFFSIRESQTLDLRASAHAPADTDRLFECWRDSDERGPKVVAVFGANGSGKSSLLRALSFGSWFLQSSFGFAPNNRLPYQPFNDRSSIDNPTRLKFWLSGPETIDAVVLDDMPECPYSYELVFDNANNGTVASEGIFYWPSSTGRRTRLVERFEDGTVKAAQIFGLAGYKRALEKVLRPNASVVSTLVQLNHPIATAIAGSVSTVRSNILLGKIEFDDGLVLREYIDRTDIVERLNQEISRIDVGVRAVEITSSDEGPRVSFRHEGLTWPMPFALESHGTQEFLKLFPLISDVLTTGSIAIIDELTPPFTQCSYRKSFAGFTILIAIHTTPSSGRVATTFPSSKSCRKKKSYSAKRTGQAEQRSTPLAISREFGGTTTTTGSTSAASSAPYRDWADAKGARSQAPAPTYFRGL